MPFMLHGVLGGPKKKVKRVARAKIQRPTSIKSEEIEVVVVEMNPEASVAPAKEVPVPLEVFVVESVVEAVEADEEIDPILEEDKNFSFNKEFSALKKKSRKRSSK